ncbi:trans-1,2-dihydrobenzene-1,2-diol dehydrogenase-like [Ambystoma mexicanum]|uniref:trans-1,2-dihydrobenzene-1,2-diol dehydrogenase-like n=1 Tax=Ambystoma mexicanum TaxID=8296 RepID=UPI0037E7E45A
MKTWPRTQILAIWSRFFPAYEHIRALLSQKALGEVKVVCAELGVSITHYARLVEKELGGGAILRIGCYCIQFAMMVFGSEKPESITAKGFLYETGVDETVTVILQYSGKRQAILTFTIMAPMHNQATICGTKGAILVPDFIWCPTSVITNEKEKKFPLPPTSKTMNYHHSTGMSYEAEHTRQCLLKGLKESPVMSLADSELLANIMTEVRRQVGAILPQDKE